MPRKRPAAALVTAMARGDSVACATVLEGKAPIGREVHCLAARHQVGALCWWMWQERICRENPGLRAKLPHPLWQLLRRDYLHQRLSSRSLMREISVLHRAFAASGL